MAEGEIDEAKLLRRLGKTLMAMAVQKSKSLERLAYESGVSKGYIYDIAKGKANPSILILCRITSALEVPIWKIVKSLG